MAFATKHPENILAFSEHAQIGEHPAFVDVDAGLVLAIIGMHETHFAFAAEGPGVVQTLAVLAKRRIVGTFVDVRAGVAVSFESSVANALEGSFRVDALSILIAPPVIGQAFIDVPAAQAVPGESIAAAALEGSLLRKKKKN